MADSDWLVACKVEIEAAGMVNDFGRFLLENYQIVDIT